MDNHISLIPPYAQHRFTRMKLIVSRAVSLVYRGLGHSLRCFILMVQAPFFVASNDSVEKSLLASVASQQKDGGVENAHFSQLDIPF